MTDATLSDNLEPTKGDDGIVRAPFASGWMRALLEANNAWLALMTAVAVWFVLQVAVSDLPEFGRSALIGGAIGGGIGFLVSGFLVFRRAQACMQANREVAERVIAEAREAGVPSEGRARGCVVIHDTNEGAVDGLILDRTSTRAALVAGGRLRMCQVGELRTSPADRPFWTCVQPGADRDFRAVVPASLVPSGAQSANAP